MLKILPDTDPSLRTPCLPVVKVTPQLSLLATQMLAALGRNGVGLAANQVGYNHRLIVVAYQDKRLVMFNPEILEIRGGSSNLIEGCLSAEGKMCNVTRPTVIVCKYKDELGKPRQGVYGGFIARIIQHEMSHIDGRLFTDDNPHCKDIVFLLDLIKK